MTAELIATGNLVTLPHLGDFEDRFKEGDEGRLDLTLRWGAPQAAIDALDSELRRRGVTLTRKVSQTAGSSSAKVRIWFKKTIAPLAIAAIVISVAIAIVILLVGWALYRMLTGTAGLPGIIVAVIIIVAVLAAIYFIAIGVRK